MNLKSIAKAFRRRNDGIETEGKKREKKCEKRCASRKLLRKKTNAIRNGVKRAEKRDLWTEKKEKAHFGKQKSGPEHPIEQIKISSKT